MSSNKTKLLAGAVLLVVCGAALVVQGAVDIPTPIGAVAILGLAAGALLVGTSEGGRPV